MRFASILLATLSCALSATAAKPDFSGQWVLNLNRSEFAGQAPPKTIVQTIAHKDPALSIDYLETSNLDQDVKYVLKYTTDGKESANTVLGNDVRATAAWDESQLLVHSWASFAGRKVDLKDRWRLAENGTTIIIVRHLEGTAGVFDQTIVFDKK